MNRNEKENEITEKDEVSAAAGAAADPIVKSPQFLTAQDRKRKILEQRRRNIHQNDVIDTEEEEKDDVDHASRRQRRRRSVDQVHSPSSSQTSLTQHLSQSSHFSQSQLLYSQQSSAQTRLFCEETMTQQHHDPSSRSRSAVVGARGNGPTLSRSRSIGRNTTLRRSLSTRSVDPSISPSQKSSDATMHRSTSRTNPSSLFDRVIQMQQSTTLSSTAAASATTTEAATSTTTMTSAAATTPLKTSRPNSTRPKASPGGYGLLQMIQITSPFRPKKQEGEEEKERVDTVAPVDEWQDVDLHTIVDWTLKTHLRLECHGPLPHTAVAGTTTNINEFVNEEDEEDAWSRAMRYWEYQSPMLRPYCSCRDESNTMNHQTTNKSTIMAIKRKQQLPKTRKETTLSETRPAEDVAHDLIRFVRDHKKNITGASSSSSSSTVHQQQEQQQYQQRRQWQDAFASVYRQWMNRISSTSRTTTTNGSEASKSTMKYTQEPYFYATTPEQVILFRSTTTATTTTTTKDTSTSNPFSSPTKTIGMSRTLESRESTTTTTTTTTTTIVRKPMICFSSTTMALRDALREKDVTLYHFQTDELWQDTSSSSASLHTSQSQQQQQSQQQSQQDCDNNDNNDDDETTRQEEEHEEVVVNTDMEALRQAQAFGMTAGAEVSIKKAATHNRGGCRRQNPDNTTALYIKGYDDCDAFVTIMLNSCALTNVPNGLFGSTDAASFSISKQRLKKKQQDEQEQAFPTLYSRMGPFMNSTTKSLRITKVQQKHEENEERDQDDAAMMAGTVDGATSMADAPSTNVLEIQGGILLPCAICDIMAVTARYERDSFVIQTTPNYHDESSSISSSLVKKTSNGACGKVNLMVWDHARPNVVTFKVDED